MRELPGIGSVGAALRRGVDLVRKRGLRSGAAAADVLELPDAYVVVFDAPGVEMDDVQVRYLEGRVLVRADRFRDQRDDLRLSVPGRRLSLDGNVALPEDALVVPDEARATLRSDGTLEIRIPKAEALDSAEGAAGLVEPAEEDQ